MRIVLDTNIIVSGLNFPGKGRRLLELARTQRFELYLSRFILREVADVLVRKFGWDEERALSAIRVLRRWATIVEPESTVTVVQQNEADNRILECALAAQADYIATGDRRHLLPLEEHQGTKIVTSRELENLIGPDE